MFFEASSRLFHGLIHETNQARNVFNGLLSSVRIVSLALVWGVGVASLDGQGLTTIHAFTGGSNGAYTYAGLIQGTNGRLYGTALDGGTGGYGAIFAINVDGTGFTALHGFTVGSDGGNPHAGLIQGTDGRLYGTALIGGADECGTIFAINADGTGFTRLYAFTGESDGADPYAGLIQGRDGRLYGTAEYHGAIDFGTVFAINTDGSGFTTLHAFTGGSGGADPYAGLIQGSDGRLYGTANEGGVDFRRSSQSTRMAPASPYFIRSRMAATVAYPMPG